MKRDSAVTTVGCFWLLAVLAFWVVILAVAWHFIAKWW